VVEFAGKWRSVRTSKVYRHVYAQHGFVPIGLRKVVHCGARNKYTLERLTRMSTTVLKEE